MGKLFWILGSVLAMLAVAAGAFGAHGLRDRLGEDMLAIFETAVRYQMYHALALLAVGLAFSHVSNSLLSLAGWSFVVGILVFSGSLYILSLSGIRWLGAITPLGGVAFLLGWALLTFAVWRG